MCKSLSALLLALSLVTIGCGGDDDNAASTVVDSCSAGAKSMPGAASDPCPQDAPSCPATMFSAVATCGADGKWGKDPMSPEKILCACVPKGGAVASAKPCGNGIIDAQMGEQCDGSMLNGATCDKLKTGSTGVLACDPNTCKYDTTGCADKADTGGGGQGD
jgi:hypothetical protein